VRPAALVEESKRSEAKLRIFSGRGGHSRKSV
jgi:hypothetical protein